MVFVKDPNYLGEDGKISHTAKKIHELKTNSASNFLEIGKIMTQFKNEHEHDGWYKKLLKHRLVNLKRTQANKYIIVYEYCSRNNCQSTDTYLKLGTEKIAEISKLKNEHIQTELETFVIEKNISVTQIQWTVQILNSDENKELNICSAYQKALEQIQQAKQEKSMKNKINLENKCKQLEEENQLLRKEIERLKSIQNKQNVQPINESVIDKNKEVA